MSDVKKYYYMRLKESFFDDDSMKILEAMPDGYLYSNILLKLYLRSLKYEGRLMLSKTIPYSAEMISALVNHPVGVVQKAIQIFQQLGLVEILDNGAIYMLDIQNFIGQASTEADRRREYDRKISIEKKCQRNLGEISEKSTPEIEIEIKKDKEIEKDTEKKSNTPYREVAEAYNSICISYPKIKTLSDDRKKAIKARLNAYSFDDIKQVFTNAEASDFLKGKNDRNWSATFDWMLKDRNLPKILEGNYNDKDAAKPQMTEKERIIAENGIDYWNIYYAGKEGHET